MGSIGLSYLILQCATKSSSVLSRAEVISLLIPTLKQRHNFCFLSYKYTNKLVSHPHLFVWVALLDPVLSPRKLLSFHPPSSVPPVLVIAPLAMQPQVLPVPTYLPWMQEPSQPQQVS